MSIQLASQLDLRWLIRSTAGHLSRPAGARIDSPGVSPAGGVAAAAGQRQAYRPVPAHALGDLGACGAGHGGYTGSRWAAMKRVARTSFVIGFALLLVGCARSPQNAVLTAEQAQTLAMRLANDKALTAYHCQPFRDGQPARFMEGHWVWTDSRGVGTGDVEARVELAPDGSSNSVDLKLLDSANRQGPSVPFRLFR